ncbi:endoglucanase [Ruminiclostridium sufflavum DSM 19573]|uniref:Endoglucanase n=1 Tax=Ruminiclostridium sufflavum DSM 19573 TaxID=1121337 RepID=A0A318XRR3_9FIRM|nr:glycoside hydrolase family 9 protein [Ruminiclostridium sufflavum]PYG84250.1 endoglucanase [Ruminiclostridium sufflavum DSM 19573]
MYEMKKIVAVTLSVGLMLALTSCASQTSDNDASQATATLSASAGTKEAEQAVEQILSEDIHVNQIGYINTDEKIAVINGNYNSFKVVDASTDKVVLTKKLNGRIKDDSSGDSVCYADFSELTGKGRYYISVPELGKSYEFIIGDKDIYTGVSDAMLRALYLQRCGIVLDSKYAGEYIHSACHKALAKMYGDESKEIDVSGGWHDAGDYGRYSVPAAVTAADLLLAYEFCPESFTDSESIPESGNKVPDILDEAKYGIEWLLKMQDKASGGVYHKVTAMGFPDMTLMPDVDVDDLYVMPVSTTATADFAAVAAMAARIFKDIDGAFSRSCLNAALKAWGWLENNKGFVEFKNPADVLSGEYGDSSGSDEISWAAAELFRTTGEAKYGEYFNKNFESGGFGLGWQNVSGFAAIAYIFCDSDNIDIKKVEEIKKSWLEKADMFVSTAKKDGYLLAMHKMEYTWGSNMNVTNHAIHLLVADRLRNSEEYTAAVKNAAHYLSGRNTLSQCYITGFGAKQIMQPHHRPSVGDTVKQPVPGLVVGGPNSILDDDVSKAKLSGMAPAKCYIDDMSSYGTNEVATYWNSSAIFVFAYLNQER